MADKTVSYTHLDVYKRQIVTGAPKGIQGLRAHYGDGLNLVGVKTGDTLEIGKRTLAFVQTPMVHWPDSMVTYDEYDQILFSNDAFGQHYACLLYTSLFMQSHLTSGR